MYKLLKEASLLTLVALLLSACGGSLNEGNTDVAIDGPVPSREWQLVWSDEFEGTELDPANWNIQIGDGKAYGLTKWGNNEDQYFTDSPDNIRVEDGNMVITSLGDGVPMSAVDPEYGNPNTDYEFTSARVTTSQKVEFTYGRVEANIKIQSAAGLWQAFWLLGSESSPYGSWPQKGEIDIMEAWKVGQSKIGGAVHFGTNGRFQYLSREGEVDFDDGEYHRYAVEWDAEQIRWFVDGKHFSTVTQKSYWNYYDDAENGWMGYADKNGDEIDDNLEVNKYLEYQDATVNAPFDQDQYIIFNTAVNGNLPASADLVADPNASYLGEMLVDFVRVYKCPTDLQIPEGTGCKTNLDTDADNEYYTDSSVARPLDELSSFVNFTELYIDGPGPEAVISNDFKFLVTDTASLKEVVDPDSASNTYLRIESLGIIDSVIPTVAFTRADDETSILAGFDGSPVASGDIKFDLYVERFDETATNPLFFVGMANAPDKRKVASLSFNDYAVGEWHRVSVPIVDIINGIGQKLNTKVISEVVRFMVNVDAAVRIDNVQFACGGLACGIIDEVPVFIDSIDPLWTRGIRGNDSQQSSSAFENPDYAENDQHHVQWEIIDTGEEGHDNVIQTTIGPGLSATDPLFPSSAVNFIGSVNAISAIAALSEGEFRFDIRMMDNPNNVDLYFKVDGAGSSTGEQPLTQSTAVGDWVTYRCSIENLKAQGLDVTTITAPFVMVPGLNGAGKDLTFQWDNVEFSPVQEGESPSLAFPILFNEGGFCLPISPFSGGSFSLVNNPDTAGHPPGTELDALDDPIDDNSKVGKSIKSNYGVTFGGITLNLKDNIVFGDASSNEGKLFKLRAFTPRDPEAIYNDPNGDGGTRELGNMRVSFKLEGAPGEADIEREFTLSKQSEWEDIVLDFGGAGAGEFTGITMIIDNGFLTDGSVNDWSLYFDNIIQEDSTSSIANLSDDANGNAVVYDFDDEALNYPPPTGVCGARAAITDDPEENGNRGQVGQVVYDVIEPCGKGVTFIGTVGGFNAPIPFAAGRTTVSVDVYTERANTEVVMKVEDAQNSDRFAEVSAFTTLAGWSTISFVFADEGIEVNESFEKMMLVFEPTRCVQNDGIEGYENCPYLPAEDVYYFDNISVVSDSSK